VSNLGQTLLIPARGVVVSGDDAPEPPTYVDNIVSGQATDALAFDLTAGSWIGNLNDDDLVLALVTAASGGASLSEFGSETWTAVGSQVASGSDVVARLYRAWVSGNTPGTLSVADLNENGDALVAAAIAVRGVDTNAPIGAVDGQATANGTSHATPSIAPAAENSLLVYLSVVDADGAASWTPPAGMDERVDANVGISRLTIEIATVSQATTDAVSKTGTSSVSKPGIAFLVALTPAS
jgi:hypothetical protein